ncbi:MAG: T9SS type A sorting domain-containing protein [Saprospiraceae bacterium]
MRNEIKISTIIIVLAMICVQQGFAQNTLPYTKFTWEGAFTGNKAVWGGGDVLNTYSYKGIDFTVEIIDPNDQNTTPSNPSDYNDYTKTNTFYGRGNLALQIKTEESKSPTFLKFTFSKPVNLDSLQIWDIDMLQSSRDYYNSYVDSISVYAENDLGIVPVSLQYLKSQSSFTINEQSAVANYIAGVNGNILHNDSTGAIQVSTIFGVQELIISLSNGSKDDGKSNSHAVKITGFKFQEVLGAIAGTVIDDKTGLPLSGAIIELIDSYGNVITNKNNVVMQATTGPDGKYYFDYLPVDTYSIREINPNGYDSVTDLDGTNDDLITAQITLAQLVSVENDFRDQVSIPLAAKIYDFYAQLKHPNEVLVTWSATSQFETANYVLSVSTDGIHYENIQDVSSNSDSQYKLSLHYPYQGTSFLKLTEVDINGKHTLVGITPIIQNSNDLHIFPNPTVDILNVVNQNYDQYEIYNISGRLMMSGTLQNQDENGSAINVLTLPNGHYIITLYNENTRVSQKFVKK